MRTNIQTWTPQKENNTEWRELHSQTHFSANNDNTIALKHIDLRHSAVRWFSKSEQLPEDGQVGLKHVAIDVILILRGSLITVQTCMSTDAVFVPMSIVFPKVRL